MSPWIRAAGIALAAATIASSYAAAESTATFASRKMSSEKPLKDCTRINSRYGYYGNPWCTPVEQARWDRWDARRVITK